MHGEFGFGSFGLGEFGMILFWVIIIAAVVWLAIALTGNSRRDEPRQARSPLDILKERYATGEISRREFETKRRDILSGHRTG